ncbi:MAG: aldose 1-epimerase family protein [Eubacteriales bacterium]|nr:aldose 1-epimerase family protein [Eubacteriales bacterium]
MAVLYGREFSKKELMKRVGDISQIAGARPSRLSSGRADGVTAVDIKTGTGLSFTVLPGRCMDISWAEYRGLPFGFVSKTGVTGPEYFEPEGISFLRGFYAGLLTTCGLTYMGAACTDEGRELGLHGRIGNTPAEDVSITNEWQGDEFIMKVRGRMRESMVFAEHLVLTREITARLGENNIRIDDTIENCGYDEQPFMLLYHYNFGFPLIDAGTRLIIPGDRARPRDPEAEKGIREFAEFSDPIHGYAEQCFYHEYNEAQDGSVKAVLYNSRIGNGGFGAVLKFFKKQLPYLIEWKQMGEGDYVVGLEPATWLPEGRSKARKSGALEFIKPGEIRKYQMEIGIFEGSVPPNE